VVDDGFVHIVAGDADALADGDVRQGHDGHLGGPSTDIDNHGGRRLGNGQTRADAGCHRLLDQVDAPGAGPFGRVVNRSLLHRGDARRNRYHHARPKELASAVHLADEVAQHRLGDIEVGDDPVTQRADGADRTGGATEHLLGHQTHGVPVGQNPVRTSLYRDHGGLVQNDAFALDADQRVAGPQIDTHVHAEKAQQ
jgi:hypothetical protein